MPLLIGLVWVLRGVDSFKDSLPCFLGGGASLFVELCLLPSAARNCRNRWFEVKIIIMHTRARLVRPKIQGDASDFNRSKHHVPDAVMPSSNKFNMNIWLNF